MKMTFALLLLVGLAFGQSLSLAQPDSSQPLPQSPAPDPTAAPVPPAETAPEPPAAPVSSPAALSQTSAPAPEAESKENALPEAPAESVSTNSVAAAAENNRGPLTLEKDLPTAIRYLARIANLNIQFDPSLVFTNTAAGPDGFPAVSIRWENVTPEDALQEVLDNHGLMLTMNPKTNIGRVSRKPTLAPLVTSIIPLRYTSPTNVVDIIKASLTDPGQRSKVTADLRTRQLIVVSTEKELDAITNLVAQLDTPTRQILIEAHLLETAKNPKSIKGIDWSGTLEGQNFTFGNGFTRGTAVTRTPGQPTSATLPSGRSISSQPGTSVTTELLTTLGEGGLSADTARGFHPATAFLNADGVRAVLSFLNTENDTEVVATPRAVTLDNETATLSVTRAFPIFEITPGAANVPAGSEVKYTNLGTILKVTPRITADTNVALKVVPEVSNIDSKDRQIINGQINEANVYAIRRMETDVVVPSGYTLVMGGLISDSTSKIYSKVPILGDLPGIGLAFRRDTKSRNKANLLIFITPTIVQDYDYHQTSTAFLQTPLPSKADREENAWNSGKPYNWGRRTRR